MIKFFVPDAHFESRRRTRPPEYMAELESLIVQRVDGGAVIDIAHPKYQELVRKYRPGSFAARATIVDLTATTNAGQTTQPSSTPTAPPHWGPPMWDELHRLALRWDGTKPHRILIFLFGDFAERVRVNGGCSGCAREWDSILADTPPDLGSPRDFFAWTVRAHNRVNLKLGRREWTTREARDAFAAR